MDAQEQIRKPYPSDLSESQWLLMAPLLPSSGGGRTRTTDHGPAGGAQRGVVLVQNRVWLASSAS